MLHWNYSLRSSANVLTCGCRLLIRLHGRAFTQTASSRGGLRRLWGELEQAHAWWVQRGRPEVSEFGLTVGPQGHVVWFESPDGPSCHH